MIDQLKSTVLPCMENIQFNSVQNDSHSIEFKGALDSTISLYPIKPQFGMLE